MYIAKLHHEPTVGRLLGYLVWKKVLRNHGSFVAWLDQYFWGPSRGVNEYNAISDYSKSHTKPDKQYSILPTVISMVGNWDGKVVVDLGCGTGFFSIPFADKARKVYGIDNSKTQLDLALLHRNIEYLLKDIFVDPLPTSDIILAPFVANYAQTVPVLRHFFRTIHASLAPNGILVLVVDLPNQLNLKRFGATKQLLGPPQDETKIRITLFNQEREICTLHATYFTPLTIESILGEIGFSEIRWHRPVISDEGMARMGSNFWEGYYDDTELGYLTARKTALA